MPISLCTQSSNAWPAVVTTGMPGNSLDRQNTTRVPGYEYYYYEVAKEPAYAYGVPIAQYACLSVSIRFQAENASKSSADRILYLAAPW
eukprot:1710749-Rhodomonas_salina.1